MVCYIHLESCKYIVLLWGKVSCKWEEVCQKEAAWRAPLLQQVYSDVWPFFASKWSPFPLFALPCVKVFLSGWNKAKCWFGSGCLFITVWGGFFWVCPLLFFVCSFSSGVLLQEKVKNKTFLAWIPASETLIPPWPSLLCPLVLWLNTLLTMDEELFPSLSG